MSANATTPSAGCVAEVRSRSRLRTERWVWPLFVALAASRLWLAAAQNFTAIFGTHDDLLFLQLAENLLQGKWLGPYTHLTLIKGPFFPVWIAGIHTAGLPLRLANQAFYVLAASLFVIALRPLVARPLYRTLIFAFLVFDPMTFTANPTTRVLRADIYPALTVLIAACAIGFLLRCARSKVALAAWSIGLGLTLAALWLTREEAVALLPFVAIVTGFAAIAIWRNAAPDYLGRLALLFVPFLLWAAIVAGFAAVNLSHYGIRTTVETTQRDFVAAYGALSRVKHKDSRPHFPVPREARTRIYPASPAFAELQPFLEGALGHGWHYGDEDITGGYWIWALREAAAEAGHFASAGDAARYFRRLADEVNAACDQKRLDCLGPRATMAPPWRSENLIPLLGAFAKGAWRVASIAGFYATADPSEPNLDLQKYYAEMTRTPIEPANSGGGPRLVARGWAFSPGADLQLVVRTRDEAPLDAKVELSSSPDVYGEFIASGLRFPSALRAGFEIASAARDAAWLDFMVAGERVARAPLDGSVRMVYAPNLYFKLDYLEGDEGRFTRIPTRIDALRLAALSAIARGYQAALPILAALALVWFVGRAVVLARARRPSDAAWIIMLALLLAALTELAVLALIDVTSFPALDPVYLSSVSPLMMMSIAIAGIAFTRRDR